MTMVICFLSTVKDYKKHTPMHTVIGRVNQRLQETGSLTVQKVHNEAQGTLKNFRFEQSFK